MSGHSGPSIAVIMPVRDMCELALGCALAVAAQLQPGDSFTVVDDGSSDGTVAALRAHDIDVVELPASGGPYRARHLAAVSTDLDVLLFVDGRSRPQPGWLEAHRALFADPGVALSCTGTSVSDRPGLAARIFRASNMFDIDSKLGVAGRLAFYPTANLGVRRSAYVAVGGFRDMRSGADADLCWRVQLAGHGSFAADRRVLMEWIPRSGLRSVARQWIRYGKSSALLERIYSTTDTGVVVSTRRAPLAALRQAVRRMRTMPLATVAQFGLDVLNVCVYLRERRRLSVIPVADLTPAPYGVRTQPARTSL